MLTGLLKLLRSLFLSAARLLGSEIRDCRTGDLLGKGLLVPWRGKILVIGLDEAVVPVPVPQGRITYWKQEIGFTRHAEPNFPRSEPAISLLAGPEQVPDRVLLVLLDHRESRFVESSILAWTRHGFSQEDIFLVFGGSEKDHMEVRHLHKGMLAGSGHRTRDHTREAQSYREVFDLVADWVRDSTFTHILFVEYDQIPVAPLVADKYLTRLRDLDADILCCHLHRIDGTTNPNFLGLAAGATLPQHPILSMLGTGHFWKRKAWLAVAGERAFSDWYLELDIPTTALKLGFRILGLTDQEKFVTNIPEKLPCTLSEAAAQGAWTYHPFKTQAAHADT